MKYLKRLLALILFSYLILSLPGEHKKIVRSYVASKTVTLTFTDAKKFGGGTGVHVQLPHGGSAILTNAHVCALKDANNEIAVMSPYLEKPINRRVIGIANFTDLCLVEGLPGVKGLSLGSEVEAGEEISVVGHPLLLPTTQTHGEAVAEGPVDVLDYLIANEDDEKNCSLPKNKVLTIDTWLGTLKVCAIHINAIYTTVMILPGNSGSAAVNSNGKLIGLAFAGSNDTHWGLLVTLDDIQHFLYPY